jgi:hypothetical protein
MSAQRRNDTSWRIASGSGEIRVVLKDGAMPAIDVRWFTLGGGPAAVPMPSPHGLAFQVEDAGDVIEAIKAAELASRRQRLGARHDA